MGNAQELKLMMIKTRTRPEKIHVGRSRKRSSRRRGSITLEFALLLPILMTLGLLCVDFGRFCHSFIAVTNAAREGAAYGGMHPVTPATKPLWDMNIQQVVQDELATNTWYNAADLTVSAPQFVDEGNGNRRVEVEAIYQFHTLINWPFLPGYNDPVQLRRVVVMRQIR